MREFIHSEAIRAPQDERLPGEDPPAASRPLSRRTRILPRIVVLMVLSGLVLGCTEPAAVSQGPLVDAEEARPYTGETSLEERIALADVVARVSLQSVSSGVTTAYFAEDAPEHPTYVGHLDFNFRVLEYLKGSGGNELTAVVLVPGDPAGRSSTRGRGWRPR